MNKLEWEEKFNTGITVIDGQHQRIVKYINELHEATDQNIERKQVEKLLVKLVEYTLTHFAFEESLLIDSGYQYLDEHKKSHQAFCKKLSDLEAKFKSGQNVAPLLTQLLSDWLFEHIVQEDHQYVDCVRNFFLEN